MVQSLPMALLDNAAEGCCIFVVGAVGGSVCYFVNGALCSSSNGGYIAGGIQAVITNGPRVCRWAAWSGVFHTIAQGMFDTSDARVPLVVVATSGITNALFSMHRGPRAAVREGLKGAAYGWVASISLYGTFIYILDALLR